MHQVLQNYRTGAVLVANRFSLISAGTERMKVETGKMSLLGKARARPDLVKTAGIRAVHRRD